MSDETSSSNSRDTVLLMAARCFSKISITDFDFSVGSYLSSVQSAVTLPPFRRLFSIHFSSDRFVFGLS